MIIEARKMRTPRNRPIIGLHDFDLVTTCEEMHIDTAAGTSHIYVIRPVQTEGPLPVFLNLHGGGFMKEHGERDIAFCREMCYLANCAAISLDYRLAPEYPYPVAIDEEEAVLRYMADHADELGIDASRIVVMGQSSGGNNAEALAMRLKNDVQINLRGHISAYLPTDLVKDPADRGCDMDPRRLEMSRMYNLFYIPDGGDAGNPEISMLYATEDMLRGMSKGVFILGAKDDLYKDAVEYTEKLKAADVPTEVYTFEKSGHGFVINQNGEWQKSRMLIAYKLLEMFENA